MTPTALFDENTARQIVLVQAFDQNEGPLWTAEDRAWASRLALETAGAAAPPEKFLAARAAHALQRLQPRDVAIQRWLAQRRSSWLWAACVLGLVAGVLLDSLGGAHIINLLAPPVWGVIAWNLLVYAGLLLVRNFKGLRPWVSARIYGSTHGSTAGSAPLQQARAAWAEQAMPLAGARIAVPLHLAAAALAVGLVAGLYLRGLVFDYRAGWQSTFLSSDSVQAILSKLLSPATALTGLDVPSAVQFEALRITPNAPQATATAAPWIHLYATMLALLVIGPRLLLALSATARAGMLARRFPLPISGAYFQQLLARQRGGVAQVHLLPHGTAPTAQAVLGLRALLAQVLGDDVQLKVASPCTYGNEEFVVAPVTGSLCIALFDMATTPEEQTQGLFVKLLRAAAPSQPLLIVVDESGFTRRFGKLPDRMSQRRAAWQAFGDQASVGVLCTDLDQPPTAAAKPLLERLLAR